MMVQTPTRRATLSEFFAMPETKHTNEFIDGIIYQKPMPQGKHSIIQRELTFAIDRVLPMPIFAKGLKLTMGELFDWLIE